MSMQVKLTANCMYLAERVDVLSLACLVDQSNLLLNQHAITEQIVAKMGDNFCAELVATFMAIAESSLFWFTLESGDTSGYNATWEAHTPNKAIEFDELKSLVHIFSHIVDAKSSYTKKHSDGVANLARSLGEYLELPEKSCEMLELAGLLNDIGKLRVPSELLEKEGKLTEKEYAIVQRHSFDTYEILKNISALETITEWASEHHERLDGNGYPFQITNGATSLEARIVAVADVFQALGKLVLIVKPLMNRRLWAYCVSRWIADIGMQ